MNLKRTLKDYLTALSEHKTTKHELEEAEIRLEMECRRAKNDFYSNDCLRMLATILLGKL